MAKSNELGKQGERRAQAYLQQLGYQLLDCNWYYGHDELDIVCRDASWLVVVEVKTRSGEVWERPEEAITTGKMKRMVCATQGYLEQHNLDLEVRFDVVTVVLLPTGEWKLHHFIDAFLAPVQ